MAVTRHLPCPIFPGATVCSAELSHPQQQRLAKVGESINCTECRQIINVATKCVAPHRYILARAP
jgi:hypothetical protein